MYSYNSPKLSSDDKGCAVHTTLSDELPSGHSSQEPGSCQALYNKFLALDPSVSFRKFSQSLQVMTIIRTQLHLYSCMYIHIICYVCICTKQHTNNCLISKLSLLARSV